MPFFFWHKRIIREIGGERANRGEEREKSLILTISKFKEIWKSFFAGGTVVKREL
jgi:hypothetical protein